MRGLIVWFFVLVNVSIAWASGGGGGEHEVEMVPFFSSNFLWAVINFSILAFILYKFGKEPLREALAKRQETIEKTLDHATEARQKATEALREAKSRLSDKDTAVQEILADAKAIADREKQKILEQGERLSRDIVERARMSVGLELKRARDELKAEAVALAMELAEKKIRETVSDDGQQRLVADYVEKMESRN